MATMSTGQVSIHVGFLVTKEYIANHGLKPVEVIKSHPRWNEDDMPKLCKSIAADMNVRALNGVNWNSAPKPSTKKPAAVDVSDL